MANRILLALILLSSLLTACQPDPDSSQTLHSIIPKPQSVQAKDGFFKWDHSLPVYFNSQELRLEANYLQDYLFQQTGVQPEIKQVTSNARSEGIYLLLSDSCQFESPEGYQLSIQKYSIQITAQEPSGIFYGIQSLWQLLPANFHSEHAEAINFIPCGEITDEPAFIWRGMLLDCSRHFMEVDFIKRYLDLLALHKMNRFHWHLTEDQGWRIEIKKYPRLTEHGAWRIEEDGSRYGGFYTQDEIREVVAYARERHIEVVPEIELPGHSVAAISSYPHLSCTGDSIPVANRWGVFKDIYCAGQESTFEFLENVLAEVMELFPYQYIHIGGDEAPTYRWELCEHCQNRIKQEGLESELELQNYFIQRIETFVSQHGKRIIGWDEILEGGLSEQATVQSWRGFEGAQEAAHQGHAAIVSPTSHAYFDYPLESIDLKKVYHFNPIPSSLEPAYHAFILGGECNMWTERAPQSEVDDRMFPRMLAMAEALWTGPVEKDFPEFHERVQGHYDLLDALEVAYGLESTALFIRSEFDSSKESFQIELLSSQPGYQIHFSLDGTIPLENGQVYLKPIQLDRTAVLHLVATKASGGREHHLIQNFYLHKGLKKAVNFAYPFHDNYPGNDPNILTNGLGGSLNFRDGEWQGFYGTPLIALIDLQEPVELSSVSGNFLQSTLSWIYLPKSIRLFGSTDGETFTEIASEIVSSNPRSYETQIHPYKIEFKPVSYRWYRLEADNFGPNPEWHDAAGADSWLFTDEIILE